MTTTKPIDEPADASAKRDQVNVNLLGLSPRLREQAARRGITFSAAIRSAIVQWLDTESDGVESEARDDIADDGKVVRVLLRLSSVRATLLVTRARACGMSRSHYVDALMDGTAPAALPKDHASMVAALRASTDKLAAMSVDLNAFMRLLVYGTSAEVKAFHGGVRSVAVDVRAHLKAAATVLAELSETRRWR